MVIGTALHTETLTPSKTAATESQLASVAHAQEVLAALEAFTTWGDLDQRGQGRQIENHSSGQEAPFVAEELALAQKLKRELGRKALNKAPQAHRSYTGRDEPYEHSTAA